MADAQLVNFIKGQLAVGRTKEQLTTVLIANGWPQSMIAEAFQSLDPVGPPAYTPGAATQPQPQPQTQSHGPKVLIIVLVTIVLLGIGAFFGTKYFLGDVKPVQVITETNTTEENLSTATSSSKCVDNELNCLALAAQTCAPNTIVNVSSGVSIRHEIVGMEGVNCHYKEYYFGGTVVFNPTVVDKALKAGTTQDEIDGLRDFLQYGADYTKGKVSDCKAPSSELAAYLQARIKSIEKFEESGDITTDTDSIEGKFINDRCTGLN